MMDHPPLPPIHVQVVPIEVVKPAPEDQSRAMGGPRDQALDPWSMSGYNDDEHPHDFGGGDA